jgi:hypothetical protein
MSTTTETDGGPTFGANLLTALFLTWLFVGGTVFGLGVFDTLSTGFADGWPLMLGGGFLLVFATRDWFLQDGGEFASDEIGEWFLLVTAFVFAVTLWAIVGRLGVV